MGSLAHVESQVWQCMVYPSLPVRGCAIVSLALSFIMARKNSAASCCWFPLSLYGAGRFGCSPRAERRRRGEGRGWQGDVDRWYEEEGLGDGVDVVNVGAVVEACRCGVAARLVPLRFPFPGELWLRWVYPVLRPTSVSWPGDSSLLRRRVRLGPFREL